MNKIILAALFVTASSMSFAIQRIGGEGAGAGSPAPYCTAAVVTGKNYIALPKSGLCPTGYKACKLSSTSTVCGNIN